jgi:hypothetical protein
MTVSNYFSLTQTASEPMGENLLSTQELAALLFFQPHELVEARLVTGHFRCTHFLSFDGNLLSDEGIDGEARLLTLPEWVSYYKKCEWQLDEWLSSTQ